MGGFLEFLVKILSLPSKIGAGVALAAATLYVLRAAGIEPFSSFDSTHFAYIAVAGVVGAVIAIIDVMLSVVPRIWCSITGAISACRLYIGRRRHAIRTMDALSEFESAH